MAQSFFDQQRKPQTTQEKLDAARRAYEQNKAFLDQYNSGHSSNGLVSIPAWQMSNAQELRNKVVQGSIDVNNLQQQVLSEQRAAEADAAKRRNDELRNKIYGLAEGRLDALSNDPIDQMVLQALQDRASGKVNPYDQTTQNALFTQQAQMASDAEKQALQSLAKRGLSPSDPAYQSALQEITAQRQGALQGARLNLDATANLANYQAQDNALFGLSDVNARRNAAITDASNYLGGLYSRETNSVPESAPTYAMPSFQEYQQAVALRQPVAPTYQQQPRAVAAAPQQPQRQVEQKPANSPYGPYPYQVSSGSVAVQRYPFGPQIPTAKAPSQPQQPQQPISGSTLLANAMQGSYNTYMPKLAAQRNQQLGANFF